MDKEIRNKKIYERLMCMIKKYYEFNTLKYTYKKDLKIIHLTSLDLWDNKIYLEVKSNANDYLFIKILPENIKYNFWGTEVKSMSNYKCEIITTCTSATIAYKLFKEVEQDIDKKLELLYNVEKNSKKQREELLNLLGE